MPIKKPKDAKGLPVTTPAPHAGAHHVTSDTKPAAVKPLEATKTKVLAPPAAATAPAAVVPAKTEPAKTVPGKDANWPKTLPEAKAEADAKANPATIPTEWSSAELELAKARCTQVLKSVHAVTLPEAPFRTGDCGAPAPVRLVSVGRNPEVVLSPPAVLTCDMVAALHTWMTGDLQPLAKKHLGAQIIKIETMSDYSCRNAYGRTKSKLSEHGRANALDIRGFITAQGERAYVLAGWGDTERDVRARVLAAKAAEEKAAAQRAAIAEAAKAATQPKPVIAKSTTTPPEPGTAADLVRSTIVEGAGPGAAKAPALGMVPSQLGGPKQKSVETSSIKINADGAAAAAKTKTKSTKAAEASLDDAPLVQPPTKMSRFMREAHTSACKIFGTTLGPEANNAHRNHFHIDMAPRERSNFCE